MRIIPLLVLAALPACSDSHSTSPQDSTNPATVRLANATDAALDLRQGDSVVDGGGSLAFGKQTPCTRVSASAPDLIVAKAGTTDNLPGFSLILDPGHSYTIVAFPGGGSATSFAMLLNAFRPAGGAAGFRLLNATGGGDAMDAFVTPPGGSMNSRTTSQTEPGTASALVNVAAANRQIRVTTSGTHTVLLDAGSRSLSAGTNYTLIVAPASSESGALRGFLVAGC
jgi:hypothetical protein